MKGDISKKQYALRHVSTQRFDLVAMGRWEAAWQHLIVERDPELLALFAQRKKPRSFFKTLRKTKGSKIPKRVHHKIIDRSQDKVIGLHFLTSFKHNSAKMSVIIYDRDWWGKGAVIEVRKALIPAYKQAMDVTQFCAEVHSRNFSSILNYKKLGFENTGVRYSCAYDELREEPADYLSFSLRGKQLDEQVKAWRATDA